MTDTKKNPLTILAVVLTIAVIFSACTSIFTAKAVYDLRAEAKAQTETQEDGVVILDQYEIVSTLPISEAYRSGKHQRIKREGQGDLGTGLRCAERNHHRRYDAL